MLITQIFLGNQFHQGKDTNFLQKWPLVKEFNSNLKPPIHKILGGTIKEVNIT